MKRRPVFRLRLTLSCYVALSPLWDHAYRFPWRGVVSDRCVIETRRWRISCHRCAECRHRSAVSFAATESTAWMADCTAAAFAQAVTVYINTLVQGPADAKLALPAGAPETRAYTVVNVVNDREVGQRSPRRCRSRSIRHEARGGAPPI